MFNIKSIVKHITDRSRESNIESPIKDDSSLQKTEGFLCPKCMRQFPTPWELQSHYESIHEEDMPTELSIQSLAGFENLDDIVDRSGIEQDVSACGDNINSSLSVEDVPSITNVQELQGKLQQVLNRKATLETRVVRLVQSNVTLKATVDEMDRELTQLRERHKILETQLAHRESIDDAAVLRQELVQVQRVMDEMNREREKERDDLQAKLIQLEERDATDSLTESLKTSFRIKEQECKQLCEELHDLKTKYESLVIEVKNTEKCKCCSCVPGTVDVSCSILADTPYTLEYMQRGEDEVRNLSKVSLNEDHSEDSVVSRNAVAHELKLKSIELIDLTRNYDKLEGELTKKNNDLALIRQEIEATKCNFASQAKIQNEKQMELSKMLNKEKNISASLSMDVRRLNEEKLHLERNLKNSLQECSDAQSTISDLQHSLAELQHEYQNVVAEHEQQSLQLRTTIQEKSEILQKQEDAVQLLVTERAELARQLEYLETKKRRESEEITQKLEKLYKELEEKADKQRHLEDTLVSEIGKSNTLRDEFTKLNESSNAAIEAKNEEVKVLKTSLDEMTGEKLALEAQLESIGNEQQKLLERCYASTSEIENFQHSVGELRRKWEESESALQELGRENATLQLDIEKLLARKWAEDADVIQCTLCHRDFTMLLRKHHCRNCGQIFCNECSSKTAAVVSNKKPVRVCDSCFTELRTK